MYGLVTIIEYRDSQDPKLREMELYDSLAAAINRANALMDKYHEDYGEDYFERASYGNLMAVAGNGDVNWRAYIKQITVASTEKKAIFGGAK